MLFFGMGFAVYSSIFFATPVLAELKLREPRLIAHTQRVLAKRAATQRAAEAKKDEVTPAAAGRPGATKGRPAKAVPAAQDSDVAALAGSAPRPGARARRQPAPPSQTRRRPPQRQTPLTPAPPR